MKKSQNEVHSTLSRRGIITKTRKVGVIMESIWEFDFAMKKRPSLKKDIKRDVVVIGGGMAGILTAYYLKEAGARVTVLEQHQIGSGITKNTTGKISMSFPNFYKKLVDSQGIESGQVYVHAYQEAVAEFDRLIKGKNIDCDYEQLSSYIYSKKKDNSLEEEWKAAEQLKLDTFLTTEAELPFYTSLLLGFKNQAQFHALKFLSELSEELEVYEDTRVTAIEGNVVITEKADVAADHIIVTTHYPFQKLKGYYFVKNYQEGSRVIAIQNGQDLKGNYIGDTVGSFSLRNHREYTLIGTVEGRNEDSLIDSSYKELQDNVKAWYPGAIETFRWSNQDCVTPDGLPYIGRLSSGEDEIYTATGMNKWGMTGSMVAARLLTDMVMKKDNPLAGIVKPGRIKVNANLMQHMKISGKTYIMEKLSVPQETYESIPIGEGGIIEVDSKKVGVYKESEDKVYVLSTKCPHLGCQLTWNKEDKTWDCPCHGSRFHYTGEILNNPATKAMKTVATGIKEP